MTTPQQPKTRTATEVATNIINGVTQDLGRFAEHPDGRPRGLDSATALSACQVRAQLAIGAALLAVADAIRETSR
ncbi:hypothetical protein [Streptomyces mobaraensis]|uniref:Uncharacterized protein n=1 Tax=Streptomyces mobaraensis TaxID=35621 RepID=A0A5N5WCV7_STRMB|nr:hypothetical protein [Streptomyces mobaraensis]KAB7850168.1 hypothetical protein FRZ00_06105 [Streptomyces mobaraensis]